MSLIDDNPLAKDTEFPNRIRAMNSMYKLPIHDTPTLPDDVSSRLVKFKSILNNEVDELDDITKLIQSNATPADTIVAIADLLGDVVVFCRSEALKYGIPFEEVLSIIMDSNESKLDEEGNPIYDADGKFCKGPNYWKPEPLIKELLESKGILTVSPDAFDRDRLYHFCDGGTATGRVSASVQNESNLPKSE